ncbi:hypothetical protein [Streptomyces sp. NBC_00470]|uniref:hypothetical protein n=1 Tax=Streptomyces sp. NBC_00470 TaxID=2975753 RepID=UPI0030E423D5
MSDRHPATVHLLKMFGYEHLPPDLAAISKQSHDLAHDMTAIIKDGPELSDGLRQLLRAKDSFVRAYLGDDVGTPQ